MTKQRYIVEGAWEDNDGCDPITADWIAATSAEEAEAIATKVRNAIDPWTHGVTRTFEEHIEAQERILADMKAQTIESIEASWEETKDNLGYEDDEPAGQCLTCGAQCDEEGICPNCASVEWAEEERRAAKTPEAIAAAEREMAAILARPLDSCRKCGRGVTLGDMMRGDACTDSGEGEEAGKVFVYCSLTCRETH